MLATTHPLAAPEFVQRLTHGVAPPDERIRDLVVLDLELNPKGIGVWLDREAT
jgi:hypothetical protein